MKGNGSNYSGRCEVCDETPATSCRNGGARWPICKRCVKSLRQSPLADNSQAELIAWAARRARRYAARHAVARLKRGLRRAGLAS